MLSEIYCTYHISSSAYTLLVRLLGTASWNLSATRVPPKLLSDDCQRHFCTHDTSASSALGGGLLVLMHYTNLHIDTDTDQHPRNHKLTFVISYTPLPFHTTINNSNKLSSAEKINQKDNPPFFRSSTALAKLRLLSCCHPLTNMSQPQSGLNPFSSSLTEFMSNISEHSAQKQ